MKLFDFNKTEPYVKKTGVAGYFQLLFSNFFDLVLLNLVFCLTSLPILTIGASYNALIRVCNKLVADEVVYPIRYYFQEFKKNFILNSFFGLLFIFTFIVAGFACIFYYYASKTYWFMIILSSVCLASIVMLLGLLCWFTIVNSLIQQSLSKLIHNSMVLLLKNIKKTLLWILVIIVCVFVLWALFPYSLPLVLILPFFIIALANSYIGYDVVKKEFNIE